MEQNKKINIILVLLITLILVVLFMKPELQIIDRGYDERLELVEFKANSLSCNDEDYIGYTSDNQEIGGKLQLFKCIKTELETNIYTWNATANSFDFLLVIIN